MQDEDLWAKTPWGEQRKKNSGRSEMQEKNGPNHARTVQMRELSSFQSRNTNHSITGRRELIPAITGPKLDIFN